MLVEASCTDLPAVLLQLEEAVHRKHDWWALPSMLLRVSQPPSCPPGQLQIDPIVLPPASADPKRATPAQPLARLAECMRCNPESLERGYEDRPLAHLVLFETWVINPGPFLTIDDWLADNRRAEEIPGSMETRWVIGAEDEHLMVVRRIRGGVACVRESLPRRFSAISGSLATIQDEAVKYWHEREIA